MHCVGIDVIDASLRQTFNQMTYKMNELREKLFSIFSMQASKKRSNKDLKWKISSHTCTHVIEMSAYNRAQESVLNYKLNEGLCALIV